MTTNEMKTAYMNEIHKLIEEYPIQKRNLSIYSSWCESSVVGYLKRTIKTKMGNYPKGTKVLWSKREFSSVLEEEQISFWCPENRRLGHRTVIGLNSIK